MRSADRKTSSMSNRLAVLRFLSRRSSHSFRWRMSRWPAQTLRERVNVFLTGKEKIEKVHAHVFAGFADAQQNQIVANAFLRRDSCDDVPKYCERFDRMFSVIVVPWDPVKAQKCEQLVSVPFQSILQLHCCFTLQVAFRDLPIETFHSG